MPRQMEHKVASQGNMSVPVSNDTSLEVFHQLGQVFNLIPEVKDLRYQERVYRNHISNVHDVSRIPLSLTMQLCITTRK